MTILHNHLLLNGYSHSPLIDTHTLQEWLKELVSAIDMKIAIQPVGFYVDKPGNRGLTGFVGIETSHIAIHVWDEQKPAAIQFDLYTCSHLPLETVLNKLKKDWGLFDYKYMVVEREEGFRIVKGWDVEKYDNWEAL